MDTAFIFPGQGSQQVGMGKALASAFPVAREAFEEIDDALDQNLSALMFDGSPEELTLTRNAQPALMAHSIAVLRVLERECGLKVENAAFLAGHSLGEYSALCAGRSISLRNTARLLRIRGEAMQDAAPVGKGAMAALIGVDIASAQAAIAASEVKGVCEIANDNAPGQVVISGDKARVEAVCATAKDYGARLAKLLPVSAPFHCSLMAPAAERMAEALAEIDIRRPCAPFIANVTAAQSGDPDAIRAQLVEQVTGRVRWTESVTAMHEGGAARFVELGAGKVLSGLVRRIAKEAETMALGEPGDIDGFYKTL